MAVASAVTVALLACATEGAATAAKPNPSQRTVISEASGNGLAVPGSYLGFSIEMWTVPTLIGTGATPAAPFVQLAKGLGTTGPISLRFGGDSEDRSWWLPDPSGVPTSLLGRRQKAVDIANAVPEARDSEYLMTPSWITATAGAVRALGTRAIVGLNLAANRPDNAAAFAKAVNAAFPKGSIEAFEPGNEPELYWRFPSRWVTVKGKLAPAKTQRTYTFANYLKAWRSYRDALRVNVGARVPLVATALGCPGMLWCAKTKDFFKLFARDMTGSTVHAYALVQPFPLKERTNPANPLRATIKRLMSPEATTAVAAEVAKQVRVARGFGLKTRLAEMNTVPFGGAPGVSDRFASALWAPTALFAMLDAGVSGVNAHFGYGTSYRPFWIVRNKGQLEAQVAPLYYGLRFFADAVAGGSTVRPIKVTGGRGSVGSWLIRDRNGNVRLALVNRGTDDVRVALSAGSARSAQLLRLTAPSIKAAAGVTWAGQSFGTDGLLHGERRAETIRQGGGLLNVKLPHHSAALLIVPPPR